MAASNVISLHDAVIEIKQACTRAPGQHPFFFIVGAGISYPPLPLASKIEADCRKEAESYGITAGPPADTPLDTYSYWFEKAYPHAEERRSHLHDLMKDAWISHANFRLAHLLLSRCVSNLVVTPNFDDFLWRALTLFGERPVVCDHPATTQRIDPEGKDIQILHIHGTYSSYDCKNLRGELESTSRLSMETSATMAARLDAILLWRSPIVIGYSGWEGDVIMAALKRRLQTTLRYNLYWFCFNRKDYESLPAEWKSHDSVRIVLATAPNPALPLPGKPPAAAAPQPGPGQETSEPILPATQVLGELILAFRPPNPPLTENPLGFFAKQLEEWLPHGADQAVERDIYSIREVIERVRNAEALQKGEAPAAAAVAGPASQSMAEVRDAIRASEYHRAVVKAAEISPGDLGVAEVRELAEFMMLAGGALVRNPLERLQAYDMAAKFAGRLAEAEPGDLNVRSQLAEALLNKGFTLGNLGRHQEALPAFEEVVRHVGDATEPVLRVALARALVNKGFALGWLNRREEALAAYDEVVRRFGEAGDMPLRVEVARALVNTGVQLGSVSRHQEALAAFDSAIARIGDTPDPYLQANVAWALVSKGIALMQLNRQKEALEAFEEVVGRFADASDPMLRAHVAWALVNKGMILAQSNRHPEALAALEEVERRFGDATELPLSAHLAWALVNKGVVLAQLDRRDEALAAYDGVVQRFGDAADPILRGHVASALLNKAFALQQWNRRDEALASAEDVVRRCGDAPEPALQFYRAQAKAKIAELQK